MACKKNFQSETILRLSSYWTFSKIFLLIKEAGWGIGLFSKKSNNVRGVWISVYPIAPEG